VENSHSSLTTTSYALLGLLNIRPWTTYELAKQVQRSLGWFWPRAERKLYEEPKRLAEHGMATATAESTGKRPRTVYAITPAGRQALKRWLDEAPAAPSLEFEALVKVFFADAGTIGQLRTTLDRIVAESTQRISDLADNLDVGLAAPAFPARMPLNVLVVRLQVEQELTVLRWATWARAEVDSWASVEDPGQWDAAALLEVLIDDCRTAIR
jgi:PadR family transcriptional regulator, regulatory protein AphA